MSKKRIMEIDLRQAESRFIAWDGPIPKMQEMYLAGEDMHRYVASTIFHKSVDEITNDQRQLGKKSGHGRNYKMGAATFALTCLKELNLVISPGEAQSILDGYSRAWDGKLEEWQNRQIETVRQERCLRTPFGRVRYFYDRMGYKLEREICAYKPQSTIPDVINFLVKDLFYKRPAKSLRLLMQGHDSVWLEVLPEEDLQTINFIKAQEWNPIMQLPGGDLKIPIEIKMGWDFKNKEVVFEG